MYPTCKYAFFSKGMLSRLQVKARLLRKKRKKMNGYLVLIHSPQVLRETFLLALFSCFGLATMKILD